MPSRRANHASRPARRSIVKRDDQTFVSPYPALEFAQHVPVAAVAGAPGIRFPVGEEQPDVMSAFVADAFGHEVGTTCAADDQHRIGRQCAHALTY
jgi:hypothetical protein